jgi:predicted PurR-regulated permease PerM
LIRRRATSTLGAPTGRPRSRGRRSLSAPGALDPADGPLVADPTADGAVARWRMLAWGATFVVVGLGLLWLLRPVFAVLAASAGLAYILDPVADWLERHRMSRELAIGAIFLGALLSVLVLVLVLIPAFLNEWAEILHRLSNFNPDLYPRIEPFLIQLGEWTGRDLTLSAANVEQLRARFPTLVQDNLPRLQELVSRTGSGLLTRGLGVIDAAVNVALLPIFVFYLLRDWDKLLAGVDGLVPPRFRARVRRIAVEVDGRLSAFVRGQITVAAAMGGLYSVGLLLVGIDLAIPVGLLSGILAVVPYLGTAVGILLSLVLALVSFGFDIHLLYVLLVFGGVQFLEGNFLTPRIVGDSVGLHPLVVMVAVIAGGGLLGIWGMLLAIPITAVLSVFAGEWLDIYRSSAAYGRLGAGPELGEESSTAAAASAEGPRAADA